MLYLISTPIGNMQDITLRSLEVLKSCHYVLCEDTRHSRHLLDAHGIHKPLKSYHQFNEFQKEEEIIEDLKKGLLIALVSDAGTPGICDPAFRLVRRCREENLEVTALPGPCALIAALTLSGMEVDRFQFLGFLPKQSGELKRVLQEMLSYNGTSICYESPHRLIETLEILASFEKERRISVARELTKIYEECRQGTALELLEHFQKHPPKGEIVLLIEKGGQNLYEGLSYHEHVKLMQDQYGLSMMDAIKAVANLRGAPKREVYQAVHLPNE